MISAIIISKNEEKDIGRCLRSVSWADEIIMVDDHSTDRTAEIAAKHKAVIYRRNLQGDYAEQRNFGLSKAKGEWVFFIDADEWVSENLKREIMLIVDSKNGGDCFASCPEARNDNGINGYYIKRRDYFLGKWLRYGETANVRLLRLVKKGSGEWKGKIHEVWDIKGKTDVLGEPLLHHPHRRMGSFVSKINTYTELSAKEKYERGEWTNGFMIFAYPLGKFFQNYLLRRGFLDGIQGLMMALMMSFHSFLVRSRLWILNHK